MAEPPAADAPEVVGLEDVELLGEEPPETRGARPHAEALQAARALLVAGELDRARAAFEELVRLDPSPAEALHGLAKALGHGDRERARACLERAVTLRPDWFEAWRALALLLQRSGDAAGAAEAARRARENAPDADAAAGVDLDVAASA